MTSLDSKTYYELLGVEPSASKDEIKQAYKELARIYHPDSHFFDDIVEAASAAAQPSVQVSETFKVITNAYNILSNEERRAAYDAILPKNLQSWGDDEIPSGYDDGKFDVNFILTNKEAVAKAPKSAAYGVFGKIEQSQLDLQIKEVNQQLNHKPGLLSRLKEFIGL